MRKKRAAKKAVDLKNCLDDRPPATERAVRLDCTVLPSDLERMDDLMKRCNRRGTNIFVGEIIRAGVLTLWEMTDDQVVEIMCRVPKAKRGR